MILRRIVLVPAVQDGGGLVVAFELPAGFLAASLHVAQVADRGGVFITGVGTYLRVLRVALANRDTFARAVRLELLDAGEQEVRSAEELMRGIGRAAAALRSSPRPLRGAD